ncbi:unnamed protein product, partial [marine sediment metagenome]
MPPVMPLNVLVGDIIAANMRGEGLADEPHLRLFRGASRLVIG